MILRTLIPPSAPVPLTVNRSGAGADSTDLLSREVLEKCYLPFAAKTMSIADNAKVSLLVEWLLRLALSSSPSSFSNPHRRPQEEEVAGGGGSSRSATGSSSSTTAMDLDSFNRVIEQGIRARQSKAQPDPRRKLSTKLDEEIEARSFLSNSASRLRLLVRSFDEPHHG